MNYRRDDGTGDYQRWAQGEKQLTGLTRQDLVFLQCSKTSKWSNLLP